MAKQLVIPRQGSLMWGHSLTLVLIILFSSLLAGISAAQTPLMLKDLNTKPLNSSPANGVNVGGTVFFKAFDASHGWELWKSDGTPEGTVMVKDIYPGINYGQPNSSEPDKLTNVNGTLFFSADDGVNGRELWKSDGTEAGTVMAKDIYAGFDYDWWEIGSSRPDSLIEYKGMLYFCATDAENGRELWKSDGSEAGTVLVKDICPGRTDWGYINNSNPSDLVIMNEKIYFAATDNVNGRELWKSDGSEAGTAVVKDIWPGTSEWGSLNDSGPELLTDVNGTLYFKADDGVSGRELWKSDGTPEGTAMVKDIWPGTSEWNGQNSSNSRWLTNVNGTLFFTANDGVSGTELWKSDGTPEGTAMVKDIWPGPNSPNYYGPDSLTNVSGTLYFTAYDGVNGYELWKSDGTTAGTVLLKDIVPGSEPSSVQNGPGGLSNVDGTLYFRASDGQSGHELWKSDGTDLGTTLVKDIEPGPGPAYAEGISILANANRKLFLAADDGIHGRELWMSDGSAQGTELLKDLNNGTEPSAFETDTCMIGATLYFAANDGTHGMELWKSDGTPEGTAMVKDIWPGTSVWGDINGSDPRWLVNVNGTLFFSASNDNGVELWKSDGTPEGTVMIKDIYPGGEPEYYNLNSSYPQWLANINGTLYFTADDGVSGTELWKSDGTEAGTVMVKDIWPRSPEWDYPIGSRPQWLTKFNGTLYFTADDGVNGMELWKSDGTPEGTVMVKDIWPGTSEWEEINSSDPRWLTNINGTLFFSASDANGTELWKSDGTAAGTVMVKDIFLGQDVPYDYYGPRWLTNVNGILYFTANDGVSGTELWKSDGSEAGTVMVKDIWPGISEWEEINSADPRWLTNVNGTLLFSASDANGAELWKSNGTPEGTVMVKDINPGTTEWGYPQGSDPSYLVNSNGVLVFSATSPDTGTELWKSDGTEAGTVMLQDINPGILGSNPYFPTQTGPLFIFSANDGVHGNELWRLNWPPAVEAGPTYLAKKAGNLASTQLTGAAASDPDGDKLLGQWATAAPKAQFSNAADTNPQLSFDATVKPGTDYDVTFMVSDGFEYVSDASKVVVVTQLPSIGVSDPTAGEVCILGTQTTIGWKAFNLKGDIDLAISLDDGKTWQPIAVGVKDTGKYLWTVNVGPSDKAMIRASSTLYPTVLGQSAPFKVIPAPKGK